MSSIGFVFTFINLMSIAAYVVLLVVALYFWRRYPRPSLYLAIGAALEIFGSVLQTALQVVLSRGIVPGDGIAAHAILSLVRLAVHLFAMCFLALAVYVARRPHLSPGQATSPQPPTPGMENSDQAFTLDAINPYSPPRQPR